jgi:hypothetical protein
MNDKLERLVLRLYEARQASAAARKFRAAKRAEAGDCEHRDYQGQGPCGLAKPETWCEACREVLPHYEAYHKAADKAGAALRLVLREGQRLSQNAEHEPRRGTSRSAPCSCSVFGFGKED